MKCQLCDIQIIGFDDGLCDRHAHLSLLGMRQTVGEQRAELDRLRAIFPKILAALGSGGCTEDVSVEFLEMIPREVELVAKRLERELAEAIAKR
jgi:hypothetical protein